MAKGKNGGGSKEGRRSRPAKGGEPDATQEELQRILSAGLRMPPGPEVQTQNIAPAEPPEPIAPIPVTEQSFDASAYARNIEQVYTNLERRIREAQIDPKSLRIWGKAVEARESIEALAKMSETEQDSVKKAGFNARIQLFGKDLIGGINGKVGDAILESKKGRGGKKPVELRVQKPTRKVSEPIAVATRGQYRGSVTGHGQLGEMKEGHQIGSAPEMGDEPEPADERLKEFREAEAEENAIIDKNIAAGKPQSVELKSPSEKLVSPLTPMPDAYRDTPPKGDWLTDQLAARVKKGESVEIKPAQSQNDARFELAQINIQMGDKDGAQRLLKDILHDGGEAEEQKKARELLESMGGKYYETAYDKLSIIYPNNTVPDDIRNKFRELKDRELYSKDPAVQEASAKELEAFIAEQHAAAEEGRSQEIEEIGGGWKTTMGGIPENAEVKPSPAARDFMTQAEVDELIRGLGDPATEAAAPLIEKTPEEIAGENRRIALAVDEKFEMRELENTKKSYDQIHRLLKKMSEDPEVAFNKEDAHFHYRVAVPSRDEQGNLTARQEIVDTYHDLLRLRATIPEGLREESDIGDWNWKSGSSWTKIATFGNTEKLWNRLHDPNDSLSKYADEFYSLVDGVKNEQLPDEYTAAVARGEISIPSPEPVEVKPPQLDAVMGGASAVEAGEKVRAPELIPVDDLSPVPDGTQDWRQRWLGKLGDTIKQFGHNVSGDIKAAGRGVAYVATNPVESFRAARTGAEHAMAYTKYFMDRNISLNDKGEKLGADLKALTEGYNKLPFRQKAYLTAALIGGGAIAATAGLPTLSSIFAGGMYTQRVLGGAGFTLNRRKVMESPEHWLAERSNAFKNTYAAVLGGAYLGVTAMAGRYATEKVTEWLGNLFGHGTAVATEVASPPSGENIDAELGKAMTASSDAPIAAAAAPEHPESAAGKIIEGISGRSEVAGNIPAEMPPTPAIASEAPPSAPEAAPPAAVVAEVPAAATGEAAPTTPPAVPEAVPEILQSVEATRGKGYEYMMKRLVEKFPADFDKSTLSEGSDMRRLLEARPESLNKVLHDIATENEFYKEGGTSVRIDLDSKLSVDTKGKIWFGDDNDIIAPEGAKVTSAYHPVEAAPSAETIPKVAASEGITIKTVPVGPSIPAETFVSPTGEGPVIGPEAFVTPPVSHAGTFEAPTAAAENLASVTTNQFGLNIATAEPHIYAGSAAATMFVFGGSIAEQKKKIQDYFAKNPNGVVFGTDDSGKNRIPWHLVEGKVTAGPPLRTPGFLGLGSKFVQPPGLPDLAKIIT